MGIVAFHDCQANKKTVSSLADWPPCVLDAYGSSGTCGSHGLVHSIEFCFLF